MTDQEISIRLIKVARLLMSEKIETWRTHNNGGRRFEVQYFPDDGDYPYSGSDYRYDRVDIRNLESSFRENYSNVYKVYVGNSSGESSSSSHSTLNERWKTEGNTVLLTLFSEANDDGGERCVFIGRDIYEFRLGKEEWIEGYFSPVGNNDVPYPVLVTIENVYLLLDRVFVPREIFPKNMNFDNAYAYWYKVKEEFSDIEFPIEDLNVLKEYR